MSTPRENIIQTIEEMTVEELKELVELLQDRLGLNPKQPEARKSDETV